MPVLKMIEPVDLPYRVDLRERLGEAITMRNYFVREVQEAEALLAHVTARVQKRKATVAKYEASILEMRIKIHLAGMDGDFGKDLMGE